MMSPNDRRAAALRIHHVTIEYPEEWGVSLNPHAAEVERRVADWLRRLGVFRDARGEEVFQHLEVAGYGGWPFPGARPERLETISIRSATRVADRREAGM